MILEILLITVIIIVFLYFKNNTYYNFSYIKHNYPNTTNNFPCIAHSNKYIKLIYFFKRINYSIALNTSYIRFNKKNNNSWFKSQYNSLLHENIDKIKIYKFKNVVISNSGSVHSIYYNLRLSKGCKCNILQTNIYSLNLKSYKNVLVLSQYWTSAVFHSIIECLTKVSFFLPFILSHNMYIHIGRNAAVNNYMKLLGMSLNLTLTGNINVENAYVVENSICGQSSGIKPLFYLKNKLVSRNKYYNQIQNYIVVIKRLYQRRINNFNNLIELLTRVFNNYSISIFYPNTGFDKTLLMFGRAKYIFAPHGAGLTNIILCHKSTIIVEFLPYPKTNLCYTSLSYTLGYRYYGLYQHYDGYSFIVNITYLNIYIIAKIIK